MVKITDVRIGTFSRKIANKIYTNFLYCIFSYWRKINKFIKQVHKNKSEDSEEKTKSEIVTISTSKTTNKMCKFCDKNFSRYIDLDEHVKSVHEGKNMEENFEYKTVIAPHANIIMPM